MSQWSIKLITLLFPSRDSPEAYFELLPAASRASPIRKAIRSFFTASVSSYTCSNNFLQPRNPGALFPIPAIFAPWISLDPVVRIPRNAQGAIASWRPAPAPYRSVNDTIGYIPKLVPSLQHWLPPHQSSLRQSTRDAVSSNRIGRNRIMGQLYSVVVELSCCRANLNHARTKLI